RTRPRCDSAPATTSAIVAMPSTTMGQSTRPSSGSSDHIMATSSTARNQAAARRRTKKRLLITDGASGRDCDGAYPAPPRGWSGLRRNARHGDERPAGGGGPGGHGAALTSPRLPCREQEDPMAGHSSMARSAQVLRFALKHRGAGLFGGPDFDAIEDTRQPDAA